MFVVDTTACVGKSAKDMYSIVAARFGWTEQVTDPAEAPSADERPTIHCVLHAPHVLARLRRLGSGSWTSRYVGLHDLCDKGNFARMVMSVEGLCDRKEWAFNPPTWALPEQMEALRAVLSHDAESGERRTYIVKPEDRSQGTGIFLVQSLQELDMRMVMKAKKASIAQRYLDRPLLLGGFKFDLRVYVLLIGGSCEKPPLVFLCREGLARFCTEAYEEPSRTNMCRSMAHLTNYSLNKRSENFAHSGSTLEEVFDVDSTASKRPLTAVLEQIEAQYQGFSTQSFYKGLASLVRTTIATLAPVLTSYYRAHRGDGGPMPCTHVLGYDVMLDKKFKPHLLEINNSPSMSVDESMPLDADDPRLPEGPEISPDRWRADGTVTRSTPQQSKDGKVCHCSDCPLPHTHRNSLVDLAVKAAVLSGLFSVLAQLGAGVEVPQVAGFEAVEIADHPLFVALSAAEKLFARSGGVQKAFLSSTLRRVLGPVCGHGRLEKHDLDAVSQRLRGTSYVSHERGLKPDALRLFDFFNALRQVGAVAFPQLAPLEAILQVVIVAG